MDKIIICGLGAVGMTYAEKFYKSQNSELRVLVDEERLKKYKQNPPTFNGEKLDLEYILPNDKYKADLIIISTKFNGLLPAIQNIKNFISPETVIISLLNGISSEKIIKQYYPNANILKSYFIGHSAIRVDNNITHDGIGEIVIEKNEQLINIFDRNNVVYSVAEDIDYSMWLKFTMNTYSNQTSAILNMNFGELKINEKFIEFAKKIINEIKPIAEKEGVNNLENLEKDAIEFLYRMSGDGKSSMHQDVLAGRKTEVEIFAGEIIKLGKKHNLPTPYNQVLYDIIKIIENKNQLS